MPWPLIKRFEQLKALLWIKSKICGLGVKSNYRLESWYGPQNFWLITLIARINQKRSSKPWKIILLFIFSYTFYKVIDSFVLECFKIKFFIFLLLFFFFLSITWISKQFLLKIIFFFTLIWFFFFFIFFCLFFSLKSNREEGDVSSYFLTNQ